MDQKSETAFSLLKSTLIGRTFVNSGDMILHRGEWRPGENYNIRGIEIQQGAGVVIIGEYSDGRKSWYPLNVLRVDNLHPSQGESPANTLILEDLLNLALKGRRFVFPENGDRSEGIFQVDRKGQIYLISRVSCDSFRINRVYAEFENNEQGSFDFSKMLLDRVA